MEEGATVVAQDTQGECMGRWKHHWQWIWIGDVWTDSFCCTTCGATRSANMKRDDRPMAANEPNEQRK